MEEKKSTLLSDTLIGAASLKTLLGKPSGKNHRQVHHINDLNQKHF